MEQIQDALAIAAAMESQSRTHSQRLSCQIEKTEAQAMSQVLDLTEL